MIQTIFFDFDGVLTTDKTGSGTTCKNLHRLISDVSLEQITEAYRKRRYELILGKIQHADMWNEFCTDIGKKVDIKILEKAFRETPKNMRMFEICRRLKSHYKLGVITDNNKERFELLKKEMNLPDIFDFFILSADIGSMKDSEVIFEKALETTQCEAFECIFIDNDSDNLTVPKRLGFKTIFHDQVKNDIEALEKELMMLSVVMN